MENEYSERHYHRNCKRHPKRRGSFWGTLLIVAGLIWILKETGWLHGIPGWDAMREASLNFSNIFHIHAIHFSWPIILLIVGIFLIAGRRIIGGVLVLLAIVFFLPGIIILPSILAVFFLPIILIVLGVVVISRILR